MLSIVIIPNSYATTTVATANLLPTDETIIEDEIVLDNNTDLDVSANVNTVPETTETVGGVEVDLTKEYKFNTTDGSDVVIANTELPTVAVEIPDSAVVKAPDSWDGTIAPPKTTTVTGTVSENFQTPTTAILVGSPDVVLVFDKAVTIILQDTTGQTAYKLAGSSTWILINGCTGTYANPDDPPANGECSISNGVDTKILTFHFTHFTGLSTPAPSTPSTPSTTTSSSGGHGNTGVGSPRVFGSSGGSSSGYGGPSQTGPVAFPAWFDNVSDWYREGKISAIEFLKAYQWIVENVL